MNTFNFKIKTKEFGEVTFSSNILLDLDNPKSIKEFKKDTEKIINEYISDKNLKIKDVKIVAIYKITDNIKHITSFFSRLALSGEKELYYKKPLKLLYNNRKLLLLGSEKWGVDDIRKFIFINKNGEKIAINYLNLKKSLEEQEELDKSKIL